MSFSTPSTTILFIILGIGGLVAIIFFIIYIGKTVINKALMVFIKNATENPEKFKTEFLSDEIANKDEVIKELQNIKSLKKIKTKKEMGPIGIINTGEFIDTVEALVETNSGTDSLYEIEFETNYYKRTKKITRFKRLT